MKLGTKITLGFTSIADPALFGHSGIHSDGLASGLSNADLL
jgi:hypothetical protein